jgi:hypothetical protein
MLSKFHRARVAIPSLTAVGLTLCLTAPSRADDCTAVKAAMLATVKKPHTITINRFKDGKPVTNRMVQTNDAKYVEVNGKWHILPVAADDLREMEKSFNETTFTCARVGADRVDGKSATVYTSHYKNEDTEGDAKVWIGPDGLPLKSESTQEGHLTSSSYDFAHADAPADATPLGSR